jgi:hypothetical protein
MKKLLLTALTLVACSASSFATITINLGGAYIYLADGVTRAPEGSLVQLIASTNDNIFTAPSPTSFTGGSSDDVILASFAVNLEPGAFLENIVFSLGGTLGAGDQLLLRWYPQLTTSASAPGGGSQYGEFRTDLVENSSTTNWLVPADGQTHDLNFQTMSFGGSRPDVEGAANFVVVPEPSTYALMAVGLGAVVVAGRRRKSAAV